MVFRCASGVSHVCTQRRCYSDFLKNLPRVGGGVSRFARALKPTVTIVPLLEKAQKPKPTTNVEAAPATGNRFANQYSKQTQNKKQSPNQTSNYQIQNHQNRARTVNNAPTNNTQANQARSYEQIRQAMRDKQKQDQPQTAIKLLKPKRKNSKKQRGPPIKIQLPPFISVSNLANTMNVPLNNVLRKLEVLGFENARHNYILDKENASLIADEYNFEVTFSESTLEDLYPDPEVASLLSERPPVVTIMGHVDHGKTTILDYLRKSTIVDQEFGGITQHIGAFSVITPISKKNITFLDTPGHAAFLKMRERGAIITDIVILVVAADDSVMPQTIEAIKHAKKSGVPVIVAVNKCDKHGVKIEKVLADLARHEIDIEDYGGETQTVQVSGKTGLNMDKLEEAVITLSELSEFKAEYSGIAAEGWIIESQVVKGVGNIATVLVRRGTVKTGDFLVAGNTYCKVRGMKDEHGKPVKSAGPSTPVQIWGWKDLPDSGDQILQAKTEQIAKKVIANRETRSKEIQSTRDIENINQKRHEELLTNERNEKINELKLAGLDLSILEQENSTGPSAIKVKYMIKSDVFGSAEAIKESIDGMGNDEVQAMVISHEAGAPSESDIDLAKTLGATIFCFNVKVPKPIMSKADKDGVTIKEHNIIYRLIEDVTAELTSHLKPIIEVKTLGEVEIKDVFVISVKKSKLKIAGCKVSAGAVKKSSKVKVTRAGKEVYVGTLSSLKHIKDDISEAKKGHECGMAFERWDKFELGDKIQVYEEVQHPRYL